MSHIQELEKYLHERLGTTDEILQEWEHSDYPVDGKLVAKAWGKIQNAPEIKIVGDYDADGVCASFIMFSAIHSLYPEKKIKVRIPRRFSEGYGINQAIADEIAQKCGLLLGKVYGKTITDNQMTSILAGKKTLIKGFLSKKTGKPYDAYITMAGIEEFTWNGKTGKQLKLNMDFSK